MNLTATIATIVILLLIMIPWIWRYKIKPFFAKDELEEKIKNHPDKKRLIATNNLLQMLFKDVNANQLSRKDRKQLGIDEDAYIYGEIEFLSFFTILDKVNPRSDDVFYDLGSGSGKAVFSAALFFDLTKAYGIERLPSLFACANSQIEKLKSLMPSFDREIKFINDDFVNCDISDGTIIFINATCLSYPTWEKILDKLNKVKQGSRIIVTTKKLEDNQFKLLSHSFELMSWGMNSVNVYEKIT